MTYRSCSVQLTSPNSGLINCSLLWTIITALFWWWLNRCCSNICSRTWSRLPTPAENCPWIICLGENVQFACSYSYCSCIFHVFFRWWHSLVFRVVESYHFCTNPNTVVNSHTLRNLAGSGHPLDISLGHFPSRIIPLRFTWCKTFLPPPPYAGLQYKTIYRHRYKTDRGRSVIG